MSNITVTRPDSRVNLGGGDASRRKLDDLNDGTVSVAVKVTLTAAEAQIIAGAASNRQEAVNQFVEDWLSPSVRALGEWLGEQATRDDCRICGGRLLGSELGHGTCGACGGRAVTS